MRALSVGARELDSVVRQSVYVRQDFLILVLKMDGVVSQRFDLNQDDRRHLDVAGVLTTWLSAGSIGRSRSWSISGRIFSLCEFK